MRVAFIDRDGTLIQEPADEQIDRLDKLRLVEGVIPALLQLRARGLSPRDGLQPGRPRHARLSGGRVCATP